MTMGLGAGTAILGESTGELVKPGMTREDLERIETHGPDNDVPDPFGDFFRTTKSGRSAAARSVVERPSVTRQLAAAPASGDTKAAGCADAKEIVGSVSSSSHAPLPAATAPSCAARIADTQEQPEALAPPGCRRHVVPLVASLSFRGAAAAEALLREEISSAGPLPPTVLGAALRHCADRGLLRCVRLLVQQGGAPLDEKGGAGASTTQRSGAAGCTALQLAAGRGNVEVCRFLLGCGADRAGVCHTVERHLAPYEKWFVKELAELRALLGGSGPPPPAPPPPGEPGLL